MAGFFAAGRPRASRAPTRPGPESAELQRKDRHGAVLPHHLQGQGLSLRGCASAAGRVAGAVLSDQIRSLDWRARHARFATQVPSHVVSEVREKLAVILRHDSGRSTAADPEHMFELLKAVISFVESFELAFDHDWSTTKANLEDPSNLIDDNGTFLQPLVGDESNNWGNRGSLLASYRDLLSCMEKYGVRREMFS